MTPEEYVQQHKAAFRIAFDFLNAHFPPGQDPEWFEQTAKDFSEVGTVNYSNDLAIQLLLGVYSYLEHEWKRRNLHADH